MKRRTTLIILGVIIAILSVTLIVLVIKKLNSPANEEKEQEIVELSNIPGYGYALEDRDTKLYKETFEKLNEELSKETIDFNEYAKLLSELYIIDLYTIDNKINQYDIGGASFVLESTKEQFELKVRDTIYKYLEDNSYGKRNQELPEVADITSSEANKTTVKVGEQNYEGYECTLNWTYVKDLGYDTSAKITLARLEDKLYIISQSASE